MWNPVVTSLTLDKLEHITDERVTWLTNQESIYLAEAQILLHFYSFSFQAWSCLGWQLRWTCPIYRTAGGKRDLWGRAPESGRALTCACLKLEVRDFYRTHHRDLTQAPRQIHSGLLENVYGSFYSQKLREPKFPNHEKPTDWSAGLKTTAEPNFVKLFFFFFYYCNITWNYKVCRLVGRFFCCCCCTKSLRGENTRVF